MLSGADGTGVPAATPPGWPVPRGAVQILPPGAQRTDRAGWLAARAAGVGGSDIATIIRAVGWESVYGLWLAKTGRRREQPVAPLAERGSYLEPAIAQWFADRSRLSLRATGTWARLERDPESGKWVPGWMRCNPDRFTSDGGILEIKAPHPSDWGRLWDRGPALHAVAQLMWCLIVLDLRHGYVAADLGADGLQWWRIERDPDIDGWLVERAAAFMALVIDDEPPPVDGSEETTLALKQSGCLPPLAPAVEVPGCADWARTRAELRGLIKDADKEIRLIENRFREALREAVVATDGGTPVLAWPWAALDSDKVEPYRVLRSPTRGDVANIGGTTP